MDLNRKEGNEMGFIKNYSESSFYGLLKTEYPELLPQFSGQNGECNNLIHSTTIAALKYEKGVIIGGDRRATINGHIVVNEHVIKVFKSDDYSAVAIAGTFGPSVKMAKLFQVELEHYEKMEGIPLTLEGKANRLSQLIEQNFPAAMQGLPVMPLFAGYDLDDEHGKIFEYDITGGTFIKPKEEPYSTSGSGGERAAATLEHFHRDNLSESEGQDLMIKSLDFAAKKDAATGGRNYIIKSVSAEGVKNLMD